MALIIKNVSCAVVEIGEAQLRDIILNYAESEIEGRSAEYDISKAVIQSDGYKGFVVTFLPKQ